MNPLYANAIDSFKVGCEYALSSRDPSSRKHAILTIFHAIELLLKERIYREHPLLVYRRPSARLEDDPQTVGVKEALAILDNLELVIHKEPRKWIEQLQKRRNRIEHHRYDEEERDREVLEESISFVFFFIEVYLEEEFHDQIGPELMRDIQSRIFKGNQRDWIAYGRLDAWLSKVWPKWDPEESDMPEEFPGTDECPICRQEFLVISEHKETFCYYCNTPVDAMVCSDCGFSDLSDEHYCR